MAKNFFITFGAIAVIVFGIFVYRNHTQTLSGWVVPSGWTVDGNSLTTMMPTGEDTTLEQEGGDYGDNIEQKRGTTYSQKTYADGFIMEFEYSFVRNGDDGYVQPDTNKNDLIDDQDRRKVSFVGNSGIKLGSYRGSDTCWEIAILDVEAMVNLVGSVNTFETLIDDKGMVHLSDIKLDSGIKYENEHLSQLMNGVGYKKDLYNIVDSAAKSYRQLFEENYKLFSGNGGKMKIVYDAGTLSVYVWKDDSYIKYYEAADVPITGGDRDGRVYIQSHWGSGVTFSDISITDI
jgi:hypothetical protein